MAKRVLSFESLLLTTVQFPCPLHETLPMLAHPLAPVHFLNSYCIAAACTGRLVQLMHTSTAPKMITFNFEG